MFKIGYFMSLPHLNIYFVLRTFMKHFNIFFLVLDKDLNILGPVLCTYFTSVHEDRAP